MNQFIFFDGAKRQKFLNPREGEVKFGERLTTVSSFKEMEEHPAEYVVFGIPEDVGIRGNFGKSGAATTWISFLSAFLNIQVNRYNDPKNCLVLGAVNCDAFMTEAERVMEDEPQPQKSLGAIADQIDAVVSEVVQTIVAAGKTPIVIGGGHNNAYGNIKGTSKALGNPVNILNIDAHTDLRRMDYRHSGNGFSYAKADGFMKNYALFGIHKNYTPQYIFDQYDTDDAVKMWFFEDWLAQAENGMLSFDKAMTFAGHTFGLEIDCDAIQNFSSSAMTPTGFSVEAIRRFIFRARLQNVHYLHLTEAAAKENPQIGKALSYFVSDFMR